MKSRQLITPEIRIQAAQRFDSPAAVMARQLSHQATKLAKMPLRTHDEGGRVEPVLIGIADTEVARLFEWNDYFFFIPEPISIIPPPNKATPTAKNMKALCP
jgi:hypothetical protein